jgi:hypothetical protein
MPITYKPMSGSKKQLTAPIMLERPSSKTLSSSRLFKAELRTNPADVDSAKNTISFPYFKDGSPEELIDLRKNLEKVFLGQALTTGPQQYAMARQVLQGEALALFNNKASELGPETVAHYSQALFEVFRTVFGKRALQRQKKYMRRGMRKIKGMRIRTFVSRLREINLHLALFPNGQAQAEDWAGEGAILEDDELIDIIEFSIPNSWKSAMTKQGFVPENHTIIEVIEFCERYEEDEVEEDEVRRSRSTRNVVENQKGSAKRKRQEKPENSNFCFLHGSNCGHTSADCEALKRLRNERQNKKPRFERDRKGYQDKKRGKFYGKSDKEINAIIDYEAKRKAVKFASQALKKRKSQKGELQAVRETVLADDVSMSSCSESEKLSSEELEAATVSIDNWPDIEEIDSDHDDSSKSSCDH